MRNDTSQFEPQSIKPEAKRHSKNSRSRQRYSRVRVKRNGAISLDGYTPEQRHVIDLLSLGSSIDSAMESVKKSRSCFYKWAEKNKIFGAIAQHARAVHQAAIDDAFHEADADARRLIHRIIVDDNVSPATRLRAALACLNRKPGSWLPHELPPYSYEPEFTEDELHCRPVNPAPEDADPEHNPDSEPDSPAGGLTEVPTEGETCPVQEPESASELPLESAESVEFENEAPAAFNSAETQLLTGENAPKSAHTKNAGCVEFRVPGAGPTNLDDIREESTQITTPQEQQKWHLCQPARASRCHDSKPESQCKAPVENGKSVEFENEALIAAKSIENQPLTAAKSPRNACTKNAVRVEFGSGQRTRSPAFLGFAHLRAREKWRRPHAAISILRNRQWVRLV